MYIVMPMGIHFYLGYALFFQQYYSYLLSKFICINYFSLRIKCMHQIMATAKSLYNCINSFCYYFVICYILFIECELDAKANKSSFKQIYSVSVV